jgi:hypothetical protein
MTNRQHSRGLSDAAPLYGLLIVAGLLATIIGIGRRSLETVLARAEKPASGEAISGGVFQRVPTRMTISSSRAGNRRASVYRALEGH